MADIQSNDQLIQWLDRWKTATRTTRARVAMYAAKGRAYYSGIQHVVTGDGPTGFLQAYNAADGRAWPEVYRDDGPMQVTLNKITSSIVQLAAGTNFNALEFSSVPRAGDEDPMRLVSANLIETVYNVAADMMGLVHHCQTANFERYLDGMHGIGFRIVRSDLPQPDGSSVPDYEMEAYDFDGYMLTLDPTCKSRDLREHPWVVLTEVITFEAAKKRYGDEAVAGIDPKKLPRLGSLRTMEVHFHGITRGQMFSSIAACSHEPAIMVNEIFMRGRRKRFDRYYVVIDGMGGTSGAEGKKVIKGDGTNPYGGVGLPLNVLSGDRRPGEPYSICAVATMIDTQNMINATESLMFQQLWDYTTRQYTLIDEGYFRNTKASHEDIIEMLRTGYVFGNSRGGAAPPTMIDRPAPYQGLGMESERYAGHMREASRLTPMHVGQLKTHVPDSSRQTALELVEMPEDDRRESDLKVVEGLIECAAGTVIRAVQARAPSIIAALDDAGVNDQQMALLMELDPIRMDGVKAKVNPDSVRRRSKGQAKRDFVDLLQYGGEQSPIVRQALAALDYPVFDKDKQIERWADQEVANVLRGMPYNPVPLGDMVNVAYDALRKGMMSSTARNQPDVMQALKDAWNAQQETELEAQGIPLEQPMAQEEAPPEQVSMQDLFGSVSAPV